MPLLFSHPAAAWLLPAVALPILFHLFFRLRRQVREFPSLMFFLRIDPRLSAKRKIHEWLILLLRCLCILLLILALARPLIGLKSSVENVARLVLIDNSGSMAAPTNGGISKLSLAARATEQLMVTSRPGDAIAVQLMMPDPTSTIAGGFNTSPNFLRNAIDKLAPSDGAAPIPKAIRAALATLAAAKQPQRELHILTDLQQGNWSRGSFEAQSGDTRIIIHRIESWPVSAGSVSLDPLEIPCRAIPVGRITPVIISLDNHGPVAAHVRLNSSDDSGKKSSREVEVPPNASTPAVLTFSFAHPGFHWAEIWLEGDAAPTANRASLGFWTTGAQRVMFVGNQDDFAAIPYAIAPGGNADLSGIDTAFVGTGQIVENLAAKPLAVILTWENWPQDINASKALEDYVRQGGTLMVVPAPDAGISVSRPGAAWLEANAGPLQTVAEAEPMILLQDGDPLWRNLRDADGRPKIGLLRGLKYRPIQTGPGWDVLISSAKGAALLARRDFDKGRVFVSGSAFSPAWSSLPLKGGFVVLMQNAVFGDEAEHIPVQSLHAGEEIQLDFPDVPLAVKSLAGSALDWHGLVREFVGLPRAGVYELNQRDHVVWVATSGNANEADPQFLPTGQVALLHDVPHEVYSLVSADDVTRAQLTKNTGTSLYRWLLLVALVALLVETWLANERSSDFGKKLFAPWLPVPAPRKAIAKPPGELTKV